MIQALPPPSSTPAGALRNRIVSVGRAIRRTQKFALLAAALLAGSIPQAGALGAGIVSVDIYSNFNYANDPSGAPYTGFAGSFNVGEDAFTGAGYDFGSPYGLTSFAAVISFRMYMSTEGFYIGGLNSGSSPVLWTEGGGFNPFFGAPWAVGSSYNEVLFTEGVHDFKAIFLAGDAFGSGIGGSPFNLSLSYFRPWGGDPRVTDGAYSYVLPSPEENVSAFALADSAPVPDSLGTLGAMMASLLLVFAIKRKHAAKFHPSGLLRVFTEGTMPYGWRCRIPLFSGMNSTLLPRSSRPAARSMGFMSARKLAILVTALLAVSIPPTTAFGGGIVSVDIYSGYTVANSPSGMPYTGLTGQIVLDSDAFTGAGYNFGQPFGLTSFAAVISFAMYMSTEGFYIGGLNSGRAPVLWTKGGGVSPVFGGPWAVGSNYNEVLFTEGFHEIEAIFLAGSLNSFGSGIGGSPFNLSIDYFRPWGGDPRVTDGAYSYVVPASDSPLFVLPPSVPDSVGTFGAMSGALLLLVALKRRLQARVACQAV